MAYGDFKDLPKRTSADKELRNKAFNIAKNPKYGRYQQSLASMVCKFFDEKTEGSAVARERSETLSTQDKYPIENKELAQEPHKPIIKNPEKGKVHLLFSIIKQI